MTAPSLLCIGNITIDESVQPDGRRAVAPGGDAMFAALAALLVIDDVRCLAPVGNDLPPDLEEELTGLGLLAASAPRRGLPTVRNIIHYHPDGSRRWELLCSEDDFDALSVHPADADAADLDVDGVLVSAMSLASQLALLPWLRRQTPARIYLDLQEDYVEGNEGPLLDLLASCDVFLPSEVEAIALAGTDDLHAAARLFRDRGPDTVVIKRADRGTLLLTAGHDEPVELPTQPVDAVDSTGAGDAFCGAFAASELLVKDPLLAVRAGASAARVALGGDGISALAAAVRHLRPDLRLRRSLP